VQNRIKGKNNRKIREMNRMGHKKEKREENQGEKNCGKWKTCTIKRVNRGKKRSGNAKNKDKKRTGAKRPKTRGKGQGGLGGFLCAGNGGI